MFEDYEHFKIGEIEAYNIPTPGHTPACLSYVIADAVLSVILYLCLIMVRPDATFLKEVLLSFMIRYKTLYTSRQYAHVLCHDYKPEGRDEYVCQTDIKLKSKAIFI